MKSRTAWPLDGFFWKTSFRVECLMTTTRGSQWGVTSWKHQMIRQWFMLHWEQVPLRMTKTRVEVWGQWGMYIFFTGGEVVIFTLYFKQKRKKRSHPLWWQQGQQNRPLTRYDLITYHTFTHSSECRKIFYESCHKSGPAATYLWLKRCTQRTTHRDSQLHS